MTQARCCGVPLVSTAPLLSTVHPRHHRNATLPRVCLLLSTMWHAFEAFDASHHGTVDQVMDRRHGAAHLGAVVLRLLHEVKVLDALPEDLHRLVHLVLAGARSTPLEAAKIEKYNHTGNDMAEATASQQAWMRWAGGKGADGPKARTSRQTKRFVLMTAVDT